MSNVMEADSPSALASAYRLSAAEVVARLKIDAANGLSEAKAARRLEEYGPNQLQAKPRVPGSIRFLAQFKDPLVLLLIVATVVSLIAAKANHGIPDVIHATHCCPTRSKNYDCFSIADIYCETIASCLF